MWPDYMEIRKNIFFEEFDNYFISFNTSKHDGGITVVEIISDDEDIDSRIVNVWRIENVA